MAATPGYGYGPRHQRPVAARPDVLAFALDPFPAATVVAGPVTAHLRVAAAGGETRDWVVTLCLEAEDGRWDSLCEGAARCPVDAGETEIPLGDVCVQVRARQRLVVLVSGGSYPRWAPVPWPGRQTVRGGSVLEIGSAGL